MRGGKRQTHDGLAPIKNAHEFAFCTQKTDSKPQAGWAAKAELIEKERIKILTKTKEKQFLQLELTSYQ